MEEITAVYVRESIRWDETAVLDVELVGDGSLFERQTSVKLEVPEGELEPHITYRFFGKWSNYFNKRKGATVRQFHAKSFVETKPHGMVGVIAYLCQAPHIGRSTARKLFATFGDRAIEQLRADPQKAAAAVGKRFTVEHAREAAAFLEDRKKLEGATVDLLNLFEGRGFRKHLYRELLLNHGNAAAERVRENPYLLLDYHGVGFASADKLYLDLGYPPGALKRQALCVWYAVHSDSEGNTWVSARDVRRKLIEQVGNSARPDEAVDAADRVLRFVRTVDENGERWIGTSRRVTAEGQIAAYVAAALREPCLWPPDLHLDPHFSQLTGSQRAALQKATSAPIGCLLGGPGTGKSFTTAAFVAALVAHFGSDAVCVMAPTGKAQVRLTAAFSKAGVPIAAKTIHSALGVVSCENGEWTFEHNELNPLPARFMLLDEAGMPGVPLFRSVLAARSPGTQVLLIGDTGQLPPIEHGRPLYDLIASGLIPVAELTEPMRNAGTIALACADIQAGYAPRSDAHLDPTADPPANFKIVPARTTEHAKETLLRVIDIARSNGFDPTWDVQVIIATNERGEFSRKALSPLLQSVLQPHSAGKTVADDNREAERFVPGDKVICTANGRYPLADDPDEPVPVSNGEFGRVEAIDPGSTIVRFSDPDRRIRFGKKGDTDTRQKLELGYACTCHKMQGSECKIAVVALDPAGARVCSREWLRTAISRGKFLTVAIGDPDFVRRMLRRSAVRSRKTFLRERLLEAAAS